MDVERRDIESPALTGEGTENFRLTLPVPRFFILSQQGLALAPVQRKPELCNLSQHVMAYPMAY